MGLLKRKEVILLLRLIVGATFVYASYDKVLQPGQFAIMVRSYQIIPVGVSNLFALVLAWSELVSGVLLILGVFTRQAAGALLMLLIMFVAAASLVMVKGLVVDCGCFGPDGNSPVGVTLLVRNILMAVACVLIMRFDTGFVSLGKLLPARG